MKHLIKSILENYINEGGVTKSTDPPQVRYQRVADEVIKFMDHEQTNFVPNYRFLQDWRPQPGDTYTTKIKQVLEKNLYRDEYDTFVKPLIKKMRPDVSFTTSSREGFQVDVDVVVFSTGEKIVFNTFKMNGIKLIYNDPQFQFTYIYNGEKKIKRPDFYWPAQDTLIEVAGLQEESYGKNYQTKLKKAVQKLKRMGKKIIVLDYNKYLKNTKGFYEYVCETFGFPYDPKDFWLANQATNVDIEKIKRDTEELIKKGASKSYGERWIQNRNITKLLTKDKSGGGIVGKPEGYLSAAEFKRETGIGLRESDPELRAQLKNAWCQSSGSNRGTYEKFRELYQGVPISITTVEKVKKRFPKEFDINQKQSLCQNTGIENKTQELDKTEQIDESVYLRRRISASEIETAFRDAINYALIMFKRDPREKKVSLEQFELNVLSLMMDEFHPKLIQDREEFPYDEIKDMLVDLFRDRINARYYSEFGV